MGVERGGSATFRRHRSAIARGARGPRCCAGRPSHGGPSRILSLAIFSLADWGAFPLTAGADSGVGMTRLMYGALLPPSNQLTRALELLHCGRRRLLSGGPAWLGPSDSGGRSRLLARRGNRGRSVDRVWTEYPLGDRFSHSHRNNCSRSHNWQEPLAYYRFRPHQHRPSSPHGLPDRTMVQSSIRP